MTKLVRSAKRHRPQPKGRSWPLQDAKARFSEVVRYARENGPQRVTVHGKESVVVVSAEEFAKLTIHSKYPTLRSLLVNSPLKDVDFEFDPVEVTVRPVDL